MSSCLHTVLLQSKLTLLISYAEEAGNAGNTGNTSNAAGCHFKRFTNLMFAHCKNIADSSRGFSVSWD